MGVEASKGNGAAVPVTRKRQWYDDETAAETTRTYAPAGGSATRAPGRKGGDKALPGPARAAKAPAQPPPEPAPADDFTAEGVNNGNFGKRKAVARGGEKPPRAHNKTASSLGPASPLSGQQRPAQWPTRPLAQCIVEGCVAAAVYRPKGGPTVALYCEEHKRGEMVRAPAVKVACEVTMCTVKALYGLPWSENPVPRRCAVHKLDGMIDMHRPRCRVEGCLKQPNFGYEGDRKGYYCSGHKRDGMVNVTSRRCAHPGCRKQPSFAWETDARGSHCGEHMLDGMVSKCPRCRANGCLKRPVYNVPGEPRGKLCAVHMLPGMVEIGF